MLSRWPIRYKLWLGVAMLFAIVAILSFSSFRGVYAYRQLARSISRRSAELPLADNLARSAGELRDIVRTRQPHENLITSGLRSPLLVRDKFRTQLMRVQETLDQYRKQLNAGEAADPRIGDNGEEWETVFQIERTLERIRSLDRDEDWIFHHGDIHGMEAALDDLHQLALALPTHLHRRMHDFRDEVRVQYRTWIVLTWISSLLTAITLVLLLKLFYTWVFSPLRILVRGSRRVASGDFQHRIQLNTRDEMAELAAAMNDMTSRFCEIRDDLDAQVRQRTKEVVRSEQLASVGFLAAGVAHEINNPLASIAWCAESLESRLHEVLHGGEDQALDEEQARELDVLRRYLRRIQDEAFRCKGITEKLLDFSRLGDVERQETDLRELVRDVIEMIQHLGKYRQKHLEFTCDEPVRAPVNAQEMKQVVLNLITNALDSLEAGGCVQIRLRKSTGHAELCVADNGCGMSEEVQRHLFEPFFTRRRDGQGTGLGLSITYRIVTDHGGMIEPYSEGPGKGSRFRVTLPLKRHEKEPQKQQAA